MRTTVLLEPLVMQAARQTLEVIPKCQQAKGLANFYRFAERNAVLAALAAGAVFSLLRLSIWQATAKGVKPLFYDTISFSCKLFLPS